MHHTADTPGPGWPRPWGRWEPTVWRGASPPHRDSTHQSSSELVVGPFPDNRRCHTLACAEHVIGIGFDQERRMRVLLVGACTRTGRTARHRRPHRGGTTGTDLRRHPRTDTGLCPRSRHRLAAGNFGRAAARLGALVEFDVVLGLVRLFLADQVVAVLADRPGLLPGSEPTTDRGESAREGRTAQGRMPATTSSSGNGLPR